MQTVKIGIAIAATGGDAALIPKNIDLTLGFVEFAFIICFHTSKTLARPWNDRDHAQRA